MATNEIYKNAKSILSVSLTKNQFSKEENNFIGRVTRNTVTLENLIASILAKNPGVPPRMIEHVAHLLGDEMLEECKKGNAVDVLELGTLYIGVCGVVKGKNPTDSNIPGFKLNFTTNAKIQTVLDSLKVDKVLIQSTAPLIDKIINDFNQKEDGFLTLGKGVKLLGSKLKVFGDKSGIYFAPVEDGNIIEDESLWLKVDSSTMGTNNPKTLSFYVPEGAESGKKYVIVIRTRYGGNGKELKNLLETYSTIVTVA